MNTNLFKAKLVEKGMNIENLAAKIGLSSQTVYNKLKNDSFKRVLYCLFLHLGL